MEELLLSIWNWLGGDGNTERATFLLTAFALLAGWVAWWFGLWGNRRRSKAQEIENQKTELLVGFNEAQPTYDPDNPVISLARYTSDLKAREDELRAELEAAHADEKAILNAQLAQLSQQQENPEEAFAAFKTRIAELEALLGNAETEDEQAAKTALEEGDLLKADDIFARIQAANQMFVKKAAKAAYARGEIAEEQIRWRDAAAHYDEAARLDPNYDPLFKARELAWRSGDYPNAIRHGEDLIAVAIKEFGENSEQHATSLNEHATSLNQLGRYDEAEPLYREALKIGEATLGKDHPDFAQSLSNLAELLRATGRYEEAEPLYREAIETTGAALGKDHPHYATYLNNLALLLKATGRYEEAEPLYEQAMETTKAALGKDHPDYAGSLNNLAGLLEATGRYEEAEPLYREAMKTYEVALGKDHPNYATSLNNLAKLLQATGRYEKAEPLFMQAIEIFANALGEDHPHTQKVRANLEALRKETGKA